MSKSVRKVVGVVASIAVPFAIPAIVGALGASTAFGGALASMAATKAGAATLGGITGAALGAGAARLGGMDWRQGALFGGIGGGVAGFFNPAATVSPLEVGASAPGLTGAESLVIPDTGAISAYQVPAGLPDSSQLGANLIPTGGYSPYGAGLAVPGAEQASFALDPSTFGIQQPQIPYADQTGMIDVGTLDSPRFGAAARNMIAGNGGTPTFGEAVRGIPGEIAQRFRDPEALADLTLRAGASLLSGVIADDGLSDDEKQLLRAQMADLNRVREQDKRLFDERMRGAQQLLQQAQQRDPEYAGLMEQRRFQSGAEAQMRERRRDAALTNRSRAGGLADERRAGLAIAAGNQSAYLRGADAARNEQQDAYGKYLNALPTGAPTGSLSGGYNLSQLYAGLDDRRRQAAGDVGRFVEPFIGPTNKETGEKGKRNSSGTQNVTLGG